MTRRKYTRAEIAMYRRANLRAELDEHTERAKRLEQELVSLRNEQGAYLASLSATQASELQRYLWRREREGALARELDSHVCHLPADTARAYVTDHEQGDARGVVTAARSVLHERAVRAMLATGRGLLSPAAFRRRSNAFALWGFCAAYLGALAAVATFTGALHTSPWALAAVLLCALPGALGALLGAAVAVGLFIEDAGIEDGHDEPSLNELLARVSPQWPLSGGRQKASR